MELGIRISEFRFHGKTNFPGSKRIFPGYPISGIEIFCRKYGNSKRVSLKTAYHLIKFRLLLHVEEDDLLNLVSCFQRYPVYSALQILLHIERRHFALKQAAIAVQ